MKPITNRTAQRLTTSVGVVVIALLAGAGCYDHSFPTDATDAGSWAVAMKITPNELHPGNKLTYSFTVTRDGQPAGAIKPEATITQTAGGSLHEVLPLAAGDPGVWTTTKALAGGSYRVDFAFDDAGETVTKSFPVVISGH